MRLSRSRSADVALLIAAAVSLTCGSETSGLDSTAVARVVISPDSGAIDTGDSLSFTAVARNASGADLSGKTITWSTLDAGVVVVTSSGVVHGHWPGSARVVATSEGKADTARVRVTAKITSIAVTPALDTIRSLFEGVSLTVRARIDTQIYAGGSYTWQVADTAIAWIYNLSADSSQASLYTRANGTTIIRVREARGAMDSARLVVRQLPKTISFPGLLRAYRACPFRVAVSVADSFGTAVQNPQLTWTSTDTTLARIDSTGLLTPLASGVDTITVQAAPVSRSAPLTISVAPAVTLGISGVASAVTTVGRGQFALGSGGVVGGSTDAPARFSIVSSDTAVVAVPSDTSVGIGGQPGFGPLRLVGRALGTVTLTPYLCDVPGAPVGLTVTPPVLRLSGGFATTARIDDPPGSLAAVTQDSTGALQYAADPVTVQITSTDTTVLRPDSVFHHIPTANFRADFAFTYPESGSARVIVRDSAGLYSADSTAVVHIEYPPIYFSDYLSSTIDTLRVGMRQRAYPPNQHSQVVLDRLVVGAALPIHLTLSDTAIAHAAPDSVSIPVGGSSAPIDIAGGDVRGTSTLTAHASRHLDGHLVVKTDRPRVLFYNFGSGQYPGDSMRVQLVAYDSATLVRGYPTENVTFTLSVNDTSVVSIDSATLTFPALAESSGVAFAVFKKAGTASVTVTDPRAAPYAYPPETTPPVTVLQPYLATAESDISLGIGQNRDITVIVNGPYQDSLIVHVRQSNAALLSLPDTTIRIPAFPNNGSVVATGTASGMDTVVVSAAGFRPDTMIITVGTPTAVIPQWPLSMAVGDSVPLFLETAAPDGTARTTADSVVFTLAPNSNIEFHLNDAVITTLTVPAGAYFAPLFYVKAKAAGIGTVTVTAPSYTPLIQSVTVSP